MAKTITIRSVGRKMTYAVTGVCEVCSTKYSIDNTVDVKASSSHKVITDQMLVSMSIHLRKKRCSAPLYKIPRS